MALCYFEQNVDLWIAGDGTSTVFTCDLAALPRYASGYGGLNSIGFAVLGSIASIFRVVVVSSADDATRTATATHDGTKITITFSSAPPVIDLLGIQNRGTRYPLDPTKNNQPVLVSIGPIYFQGAQSPP